MNQYIAKNAKVDGDVEKEENSEDLLDDDGEDLLMEIEFGENETQHAPPTYLI